MLQTNPLNRRAAVGFKICERQIDRPDQRKNVDGEEKKHRRRDKQPSNGSLRQPARSVAKGRRLIRGCGIWSGVEGGHDSPLA